MDDQCETKYIPQKIGRILSTQFRRCRYSGRMTTSLWVVLYCLHVSSEMNRLWYGKVLGALTWMPVG